jgi:hypothetical protein
VSEEFRKPVTPFGGWVRDERSGRLRSLETGPHIGGFAPPDTGITRKWLSQSAVLWPGPALVSSRPNWQSSTRPRRAKPSNER